MSIINQQIQDYLTYCERVRGMSETTMRAKRNILNRFEATILKTNTQNLTMLTNDIFNQWVKSERARGISERSINIYNSVVVAMVKYYRGAGLNIPLNLVLVARLKEAPARRRFYTPAEVAQVLAITDNDEDKQTSLMIRLMFETGMRIAELSRLKLADFETTPDGLIDRHLQFIAKGRKLRETYVTITTLMELRTFIDKWHVAQYLWHAEDGESLPVDTLPLTTQTIRTYLKRAFARAGFPDFYPHALRHSFATDLQNRGASLAEIKEMIGHSSVATTERYLHGFEGRLRELYDKYRDSI